MPRRLLFAGLLSALLLCGWGGVFAAVMCPHAPARAANAGLHPCCRARLKQKAAPPTSPHCHKLTEAPDEAHEPARDSHGGAPARAAETHGAEHAAHVSRAPRLAGQVSRPSPPSHGTAPAARGGRAGGGLVLEGARAARAVQSSEACAHCVSRPERRNAPAKARSGEGARREQSRPAPRAQAPASHSFASFAPAIIPVQGSPPAPARLHVLLNVFLI